MAKIKDKTIKELARSLDFAYRRLPDNCIQYTAGTFKKQKSPTIGEVYEAYQGLPDDHPIKKEYSPSYVNRGYEKLVNRNSLKPEYSVEELHGHIAFLLI